MDGFLATVLLITFIALLFAYIGIQKVPDGKTRIVERLGRRQKVLMPGIGVIIPFVDSINKRSDVSTFVSGERIALMDGKGNIAMAEQRMDPPALKGLVCQDGSLVDIDSVAYFKITDPMRNVYDVASFAESFRSLTETTLRQEVGKYDGDSIITSREILSANLRDVLQEASTAWGITVMRVEVENIKFDEKISEQLARARAEELTRRAELVAAQQRADKEVLEAEADKKAEILRAEGTKEAAIRKAEGEKEAQILAAQAQFEEEKLVAEGKFLNASREQEGLAQGYAAIVDALSENPEGLVSLKALEAQEEVAKAIGQSDNTLIIPTDAAGLFGAVASVKKALEGLSTAGEQSRA